MPSSGRRRDQGVNVGQKSCSKAIERNLSIMQGARRPPRKPHRRLQPLSHSLCPRRLSPLKPTPWQRLPRMRHRCSATLCLCKVLGAFVVSRITFLGSFRTHSSFLALFHGAAKDKQPTNLVESALLWVEKQHAAPCLGSAQFRQKTVQSPARASLAYPPASE